MDDDVGDVSVDKDLAGLKAHQDVRLLSRSLAIDSKHHGQSQRRHEPIRRSTLGCEAAHGTRLSEQPIHRYLGDCCRERLGKRLG